MVDLIKTKGTISRILVIINSLVLMLVLSYPGAKGNEAIRDVSTVNNIIASSFENNSDTSFISANQHDSSVSGNESKLSIAEGELILADSFSTKAGSAASYKVLLGKGEITRINLDQFEAVSLAFSWKRGNFTYGFGSKDKVPELQLIELNDDHDDEKLLSSNLIFLEEENSRYLFINEESDVSDLKVDFFNPNVEIQASSYSTQYNMDSGAKFTNLPIVSRDEWGAELAPPDIDDLSRQTWDPYYYHVNRIIIHHTVTPNQPSNPEYFVRSVYLLHSVTKGWGDVGYNFLIDHNGTIYEGKLGGDEVKGYHAGATANRGSIGIALLGDFTNELPTTAALSSLKKLMAEKAAFYDFDLKYAPRDLNKWKNTSYTVFGHRDSYNRREVATDVWEWQAEATACPGNTFYTELETVVQQAQTYKVDNFVKIKGIAAEAEQAFTQDYQNNRLFVVFDLENPTEEEVLAKIPSLSGITAIRVSGNTAVLEVLDWDNSGFIPPLGWEGWEDIQTYFPASGGSEDRLKTLMKIFMLDDDVKYVSLNHVGEFN